LAYHIPSVNKYKTYAVYPWPQVKFGRYLTLQARHLLLIRELKAPSSQSGSQPTNQPTNWPTGQPASQLANSSTKQVNKQAGKKAGKRSVFSKNPLPSSHKI